MMVDQPEKVFPDTQEVDEIVEQRSQVRFCNEYSYMVCFKGPSYNRIHETARACNPGEIPV